MPTLQNTTDQKDNCAASPNSPRKFFTREVIAIVSLTLAMLNFLIASIVAIAALCHQASAAQSASTCSPLMHPDWDCSQPFVCEANWPSETNNYGADNITAPCCLPTVECFDFFSYLTGQGELDFDYNGRLVIEDLAAWQRAECCMLDFYTPSPSCLDPPARDNWIDWYPPPTCVGAHS